MKVINFDDQDTWLEARKTKITGSKLKDIVVLRGKEKKIGYYELIAERLALPPDDENPMERGNRLESEAIEEFEKVTGKKVDNSLQMWVSDDEESIALSPDGVIGETEAVEVKCLSSARHIKAFFELVPKDFKFQTLQYFIVNEKLEKLYFAFYDPRLIVKQFFFHVIERKDIQEEVEKYLEYQKNIINEINEIVNELTF